jgi:hypothetical protein
VSSPRLAQPTRYDNQKLENLQAAAARLERGETFSATSGGGRD